MTDNTASTYWGGVKTEQERQHAAAVLGAADNPDQAAERQRLAKRAGLPVGVVDSDLDAVRRQVARDELRTLSTTSPSLASWATDPENYAVARDDLGSLGTLARVVRDISDTGRSFGAAIPRTVGGVLSGVGELYNVGERMTNRLLDATGINAAASAAGLNGSRDSLPIWLRPGDSFVGTGQLVERHLADPVDVPEERRNLATDIAGGVGQLGGQIAQALVAPETLFPSLLAQGADQMADRVKEAQQDGTLAADVSIVGGAAITGLTERYGLDKILNRIPPRIRNAVMRRIADAFAGGGIEAAQEVTEGIAQDLLTRATFDPDLEIGNGLLRQAEAAGGAGAIARFALSFLPGHRAHGNAQQERTQLDGMVAAANGSKTRTRAPERFESMVEAVAPDRMVYAPVEALADHYRNHPDPGAAINALAGNPNAYAEAMMTGAEVAIPLSRYLTEIGTDAHASLSGQLRMSPGEEIKPDSSITLPTEADIAAAMEEARSAEASPVPELVTDTHRRPLLTEMQADDWASYQAAVAAAEAEREANRQTERESVRAQAHDKLLRKQTQAAVEAELRDHPIYRAATRLRTEKTSDGSPIKLDHAAIVEMVGEERAGKLAGMTRKRDGISPDEAAAILGYPSGSKLVHDLATAPAFAEMVKIETDARLKAASRPSDADVATDAQAEVLLREIQWFENRNGGIRTQGAALQEVARQIIGGKQVEQVQPNVYKLAEVKAGREAFAAAAKQDWPAAMAARRRQLLNLHLYREARNTRAEMAAAGKYLSQFGKRSIRAKIGLAGADYLEQIDGMLRRFDFQPLTGPQIDKRTSLAKWIKAKADEGIIVDVPPSIADEAFRTPFRRMKASEVRELRKAVEHLAHLANTANMVRIGERQFDRRMIDEAMALSVRTENRARARNTGDRTLGDLTREEVLKARTVTGAATDLARELDGFKDGGAVWENTVGVIREANSATQAKLDEAQQTLAETKLRHYTKAELRGMYRQKRHYPGIGDWSKQRVLALALNWGNLGNREAILTQARNRLSPEQVGTLLGSLDARDWAFVQDVWRQIDSHWPQISETSKRRTGLVPEKVEAAPFTVTTSDGEMLTIPGGYFPLRYESNTVKTMAAESDEYYKRVRTGAFTKAATRDGHTIERVGSGGNSVKLELSAIDSHLRDVIRDLYLGDAINAVHTALSGKEFAEAANDAGKAPLVRGLQSWLKDAAAGEIGVDSWAEYAVRVLRVNFTAAALTWRIGSAMLQLTGVSQSAVIVGNGPMAAAVKRYAASPRKLTKYVTEASPLMARRLETHVEAVQDVMRADLWKHVPEPLGAALDAAGDARAAWMRWGYYMIGRCQWQVDAATWLAAEKQGMEKFNGNIRKARAYADDVVSRAQGSGDFIDKSAIQRGTVGDKIRQSEYMRAVTALQGYLIAKQNIAYEQIKTRRPWKLAETMVMLFVVDAMLAQLLRHGLPDDKDKDGSVVDDLVVMSIKEGAGAAAGGVPGLGALVTELRGYDSKGVVGGAFAAVADVKEQTAQGEIDRALRNSYLTAAGYAFGVPSSAIKKMMDQLEEMKG